MLKTLILTDLHVTDVGETIIGLDPMTRLTEVLDHALEEHPDATRLVVLGDLTHQGAHAEYRRLKPLIDACPIPVSLTIGNHDNRTNMAHVLGEDRLCEGFAQQAWCDSDTLFLLLDTADEEGHVRQHAGWLCEARLGWIADQIASARPRQIVAMMHHPSVMTGFSGMDQIRLMNGDALLDVFRRANVPVHMICGHVHRTISGMDKGFPFTILKSPCHQMPMVLEDPNSALSIDEPGAYGILLTRDDAVIVHSEDVFPTRPKVSSDPASE